MADDPTADEVRYHIDLDWYERRRRSFRAMAQARFCASCRAKVGTAVGEPRPTMDPTSGRVELTEQPSAFGDDPFAVIRECCAHSKDYINRDTPVLEAVFRVFLANGNEPSTLAEVRQQLERWLPVYTRSHGFSPDFLRRIIAADSFYGIRPVGARESLGVSA